MLLNPLPCSTDRLISRILFSCFDRVLLCGPGLPGIHDADQASPELQILPSQPLSNEIIGVAGPAYHCLCLLSAGTKGVHLPPLPCVCCFWGRNSHRLALNSIYGPGWL